MKKFVQVEGGSKEGSPWLGSTPTKCDLCSSNIQDEFVDGVVLHIAGIPGNFGWAIMCSNCHKSFGRGLGLGRGQKYKVDVNKFDI